MVVSPPSTRRIYGRGAAGSLVGRGIETCCGLAQLWLLTQILPIADFGRFIFAFAIAETLSLVGSAGFDRLTIFRLSRVDAPPGVLAGGGFAGAAMGWSVVLASALAAVTWLSAPALAGLLHDPAIEGWVQGLAWLIPITAATNTYAAWHQARQRVGEAIIVGRAVPAVIVLSILVGVWVAELGSLGVLIALIGGRAVACAGWWMLHPVNPLRLLGQMRRSDVRYAAETAATTLVRRSLRQCDVLMLLPLAGPTATAHYAIVLRFAWLAGSGHQLLTPIFQPRVGHLLHLRDRSRLLGEFNNNRTFAFMLAIALSIPMIAFGHSFLRYFTDAQAAYPVLLMLLADQITLVTFGLSGVVLLMAGHSAWSLRTNLLMLIGNAALNLALIPPLGALGAALATMTTVLIVKSLVGILLWRLEGLATVPIYLAALLASMLAALVLAAFGAVPDLLATLVCITVLGLMIFHQRSAVRSVVGFVINRTPFLQKEHSA